MFSQGDCENIFQTVTFNNKTIRKQGQTRESSSENENDKKS